MILTTDEKKYQLTKELLDQMRSVDGFPIGKDEDIIALSDPPYYTACPNPWIEDFIKENGKPWDPKTDSYNREPFAADVSEGKNDAVYNAHSYHTKVPPKAIMRYILHYTEPGDIVLDGFCGTGMTGVAAQMCGAPELEFKDRIEKEMPGVKWGNRKTVLSDLSPEATYIANNYTNPVDSDQFEKDVITLLGEIESDFGWMYETQHTIDGKIQTLPRIDGSTKPVMGRINFTIWSDVFICSNCANELIFWNNALDPEAGKVKDEFPCPHCGTVCTKRNMERASELYYDTVLKETITRKKQVPARIVYTVIDDKGRQKRYEKDPDSFDLKLIEKIDNFQLNTFVPFKLLPHGDNLDQPQKSHNLTHVHQFYTKRNLILLSSLYTKIQEKKSVGLNFMFSSMVTRATRMNRLTLKYYFFGGGGCNAGYLTGILYISSISLETSVIEQIRDRLKALRLVFKKYHPNRQNQVITTQSSTEFSIPDSSIDYIFIDPPFGGNLNYSELNIIPESWLKIFTNPNNEAIVNKSQKKGVFEYQHLMEKCFEQFYRILKPGRWMTIEFHNSQNSIWMAIQEALFRAGFVVADVRTLDKKQGTFKQVTTTAAVKQDLIISTYKPNGGLEDRFKLTAGTQEGVWDFIRQHLKHLPVFVEREGIVQVVVERQTHLLFDRMVAFHVQRGVIVPISAGDFYAGLHQRFPERDGMYFLENEVPEYDKKRMNSKRIEQASLFVHDEKSAVQWLHKELLGKSQTYADIMPKFLQELHQDKFEKLPELAIILEQNFLQDLQGKWYVPDPNKQADLDKLREKALLKEFEEYKTIKGKLKQFRTEAVRAGFKKAWSDRDYSMIITVGERLPPQILQEDDVLLMYYDNALTRSGIK